MSECEQVTKAKGLPYPRTCPVHGIRRCPEPEQPIEAKGEGELSPEQLQELGEAVAGIMRDIRTTTIPGFEVENASINFTLGDSVGVIAGRWRIEATFEGSD